ncbi:flagellar protein FlgN [Oceanobacillus bengalensis]|uniref:Flagellar protein FlgN n=1 Tax=Oceanobacillus bengalensis TaxID=1435466 RepID=A0A494Z7C0_9BACI|nr:flagellar protein FlgN [Oceanobacillus bengalensis]RKQ18216.1 flagellar protein FlgN [Oceanobacillus bengalensis]
MSVLPIIQSLEQLVLMHEELLNVSKEKTEVIKEGSVEKLQAILAKERKQIRKVEQVEDKRRVIVEEWFTSRNLSLEDMTISRILDGLEEEADKETIAAVTTKLTEVITALKQQEQLNQTLLNQSMQFVQLSLDVLQPSITKLNYGKQKNESERASRSIFDSQA